MDNNNTDELLLISNDKLLLIIVVPNFAMTLIYFFKEIYAGNRFMAHMCIYICYLNKNMNLKFIQMRQRALNGFR